MELGKQIKSYRQRDGISQEKLAELIYVSRQSISNWENEKSYPDIHNLLLLSEVFQVSLDELVKGDVDMMRNEVGRKELYFWAKGMMIGTVLTFLSLGPAVYFLGLKGLVIPALFYVIVMVSAIQADRLKKKNNIKTYKEILDYMEGRETDTPKPNVKDKYAVVRNVLIMLGCAAGGFFITYVIMKIFLG